MFDVEILYIKIFSLEKNINYLWIDIEKIDNWLITLNESFENYYFSNKFDTIFF